MVLTDDLQSVGWHWMGCVGCAHHGRRRTRELRANGGRGLWLRRADDAMGQWCRPHRVARHRIGRTIDGLAMRRADETMGRRRRRHGLAARKWMRRTVDLRAHGGQRLMHRRRGHAVSGTPPAGSDAAAGIMKQWVCTVGVGCGATCGAAAAAIACGCADDSRHYLSSRCRRRA